jgi:hypothetical protein
MRTIAALLILGWSVGASAQPEPVTVSPVLTPREMRLQGAQQFRDMQSILQRMFKLRQSATDKRDIVELQCISQMLIQLRAQLVIAQRALTELDEDSARDDRMKANHEFHRLSLSFERARILLKQAESCFGDTESYDPSGPNVVVTIDPTIPPEDPTTMPLMGIDTTRPPLASPLR